MGGNAARDSSPEDLEWEAMMMGAEDGSIDDEIKGTDEVSLSSRLYKSDEEIERYTVDDKLLDVERAVWILRNGASVQKQCIIGSLSMLAREYTDEFRTAVLPILMEIVLVEPPVFQKPLGHFMVDVVSRGVLTPKLVMLVAPIARKLIESKDEGVVEVWADAFIACIKHLPIDTIVQQILPEALVDGGLAQPAPFRIWCGRVLGAVAPRLDAKRIEDLFFRKALTLCQDTDYEVRRSMCNQLNVIAKAVGLKLTKSELLPEYTELIMDEEQVVRESAIANLMSLVDSLDADARSTVVIPLWRRLCEERPSGLVMTCIARYFGQFLWGCRNEMGDADKKYFLGVYVSLLASPDEATRQMCAYNFPGIVMTYKPQYFEPLKLDKVLDMLVSDESSSVRRTAAQGIHEVATQLGPGAFRLTKDRVLKLILSEDMRIVESVAANLEPILKAFSQDETARANNQYDDVLAAVAQKERECTSSSTHVLNWRAHHCILSSYRLFPDYFDSDSVYEQCVPALLKVLTESAALPIKSLAIKTLVLFMRKLKRVEHRETILKQLLDVKDDRSCHQRILFFNICENILRVFSRKFFRDHVFHHYLGLSRDAVPNIRQRFIQLLPLVRRTLRHPAMPSTAPSGPTASQRGASAGQALTSSSSSQPPSMDAQILQKLMDATEPLLTRDADGDVMLAMNHLIATYGPLDGDGFTDKSMAARLSASSGSLHRTSRDTGGGNSSSSGGHSLTLGMPASVGGAAVARGSDATASAEPGLERSSSTGSLTDEYLFHQPDATEMAPDALDRSREDEESKLFFEQLGTDWVAKRRELHEARQEFHRRFGDKESLGASISGSSSSGGSGGGGNSGGGGGGGGGGGMGMGGRKGMSSFSSKMKGPLDASGSAAAPAASPAPSAGTLPSKPVGSSVRRRVVSTSSVSSSARSAASSAVSAASSAAASARDLNLYITPSPQHDAASSSGSPINLSRVGMSPSVGVSLPKVAAKTVRPPSRPVAGSGGGPGMSGVTGAQVELPSASMLNNSRRSHGRG
ncbi:armadillo-type protein [Entophlyctis helioformis]|nr:armadillo-type protein [Entophlyctis helioformis]